MYNTSIYIYIYIYIYIIFKARTDKVKLLASPNPMSAGETRLQSSGSTYTNEIPRPILTR